MYSRLSIDRLYLFLVLCGQTSDCEASRDLVWDPLGGFREEPVFLGGVHMLEAIIPLALLSVVDPRLRRTWAETILPRQPALLCPVLPFRTTLRGQLSDYHPRIDMIKECLLQVKD